MEFLAIIGRFVLNGLANIGSVVRFMTTGLGHILNSSILVVGSQKTCD